MVVWDLALIKRRNVWSLTNFSHIQGVVVWGQALFIEKEAVGHLNRTQGAGIAWAGPTPVAHLGWNSGTERPLESPGVPRAAHNQNYAGCTFGMEFW